MTESLLSPCGPSLGRGLRYAALGLLALALLTALLTPMLGVPVVGTLLARDADFALSTLEQLDAAIAEGMWWPRWLMTAHNGLGGTVFYSYPPLAYWVAAGLQRLAGLEVMGGLAWTVAFWRALSVLTAWLWLRRHVGPWPALAGAALGALLPYVALFNPWVRFAYSETAAAALLPLLLLALEKVAEGRRTEGLPALALAYAALALTNLPVCALAAHLGPLYALAYGGWRAAWRSLLGGLAGAGLAGCFVLPALGLLPAANGASLFNPSWRENLMLYTPLSPRLLLVWASAGLTLLLGLAALRVSRLGGLLAPGLPRALLVLLFVGFAAMTVLALPVWLTMPQLTAIEHPWRAASFLTLAATGLLALAAQRAPVRLLVAGLLLALIVPGFLGAMVHFGSPGWPRFLPAAERMAFTEQYSGSDSAEHLPAAAAAAGWDVVTAGGPPPYPRPVPPPGTQHLPGGFLVPEAAAPFTLPQFWFPSWQARDALGPVPLRASPEGFVEVLVSRPVHNLEVRIGTTVWERAGWVLTLIASLALLAMQALNGFQAARKRERMSDAGLA